jgi:hypothetical protein
VNSVSQVEGPLAEAGLDQVFIRDSASGPPQIAGRFQVLARLFCEGQDVARRDFEACVALDEQVDPERWPTELSVWMVVCASILPAPWPRRPTVNPSRGWGRLGVDVICRFHLRLLSPWRLGPHRGHITGRLILAPMGRRPVLHSGCHRLGVFRELLD